MYSVDVDGGRGESTCKDKVQCKVLMGIEAERERNSIDSGVARLGLIGARALASRGCAPPVQVFISADGIFVDRKSGGKRSSNGTAQYRYVHSQNYRSR